MENKSNLKFWLTPVIVFVILAFSVALAAVLFHQTERTHEIEKSAQMANAISKSMGREVEFRLQALKLDSADIKNPPTTAQFKHMASMLQSEYSGFFAINFVSADGVIRMIHPRDDNIAALGKNLLERDDVRQYLIDTKTDGQPRVSHRLVTYQKIHAVSLWVPLYDKNRKFIGWMNGVLSIDNCLNSYMQDKNLSNVSVRVRWHHPSPTNTLEYNWLNPEIFHTSEHKIMNQTISIDIALAPSALDEKRKTLYLGSIAIRITLLLTILFLVIHLTKSRIKLQSANEQLSFKNNMLNSLSHDLASPLTSLNLVVDAAVEKGEIGAAVREKISKLLKTIDGMLKSVRLLHSYGSGAKAIPIENVSVLNAVNEAIFLIEQMALGKGIKFEISPAITKGLQVKANGHTLINNVFVNALTNAIKFSPFGGTVQIGQETTGNQIKIIFADHGKGLSENDIKKFELLSCIDSREGTHGEQGTGLGLLQICGFMKIYSGHVALENNEIKGTKLTLIFEKAV